MLELALRTSVILTVAWMVARLLTRASAATRHRVWHAALIAVVSAPLLSPVVPAIPLPAVNGLRGGTPDIVTTMMEPGSGSSGIAVDGPATTAGIRTLPDIRTSETPIVAAAWATALVEAAPWLWIAGSLVVALWSLTGWWVSARSARVAPRAPASWLQQAADLRRELGMLRTVAIKVLPHDTSPLVTGLWRSTILMPPVAHAWSEDRRRAVLLHELAHVQRGDCRVQALTHAACALYWFNPLVWKAAIELRAERERACDDEVLRHGAKASSYATDLLEIARDLTPSMRPTAALAMARPAELEGRLLAVLAAGRPRGSARLSRWLVPAIMLLTTAMALGATPRAPGHAAPAPVSVPTTRVFSPTAFDGHSPQSRDQEREARSAAAATLQSAPDPDDRSRAALDLASNGGGDIVPVLARALDDTSDDVREKAALALGLQSGPAVVPHLIHALGDSSAQVREKAALGLAMRRDPRSVDALITAAADPDAQVREKVAIALGTSGDPRAVGVLETLVTDPDGQVREKAIMGLSLVTNLDPGDEAGAQARATLRTMVGGLLALIR
jgi:beta-lactamase regulating signal transducer with metallopeptidase domain